MFREFLDSWHLSWLKWKFYEFKTIGSYTYCRNLVKVWPKIWACYNWKFSSCEFGKRGFFDKIAAPCFCKQITGFHAILTWIIQNGSQISRKWNTCKSVRGLVRIILLTGFFLTDCLLSIHHPVSCYWLLIDIVAFENVQIIFELRECSSRVRRMDSCIATSTNITFIRFAIHRTVVLLEVLDQVIVCFMLIGLLTYCTGLQLLIIYHHRRNRMNFYFRLESNRQKSPMKPWINRKVSFTSSDKFGKFQS